jgi:hypothetical protein
VQGFFLFFCFNRLSKTAGQAAKPKSHRIITPVKTGVHLVWNYIKQNSSFSSNKKNPPGQAWCLPYNLCSDNLAPSPGHKGFTQLRCTAPEYHQTKKIFNSTF